MLFEKAYLDTIRRTDMQSGMDSRYAPRKDKADKISAVLKEFLGSQLDQMRCLDIGCATGEISKLMAREFQILVGLDLAPQLIAQAPIDAPANAAFMHASGCELPFTEAQFDVILCAQVYEHSPNQTRLADEIWRVLRPGGVCFFSGPNKLALVEEHYWLPLLSWLPQHTADLYMQLMGRGNWYDVMPLTYWQLRRLWRRFEIRDYTVEMIAAPERFAVARQVGKMIRFTQHVPKRVWRLALPLLPNFNWVLVKHD